MSYKKILKRLKEIPKNQRVLAGGVYVFEKDGKPECGCAVGKVMPSLYKYSKKARFSHMLIQAILGRARSGTTKSSARRALYRGVVADQAELGVTTHELIALQNENDAYSNYNSLADRKHRYDYIVKWLKTEVAKEIEAKKKLANPHPKVSFAR